MPHQPRVHGKIIAKFTQLDYRNPALFHPAAARLSLPACFAVYGLMLVLHIGLWALAIRQQGASWSALLQHWDAGWYVQIASRGYDAASAAFPPLFPYLLRGLASLLGLSSLAALITTGVLLSTLCFGLSLALLHALVRRMRPEGLTWGGLLFFILSPASYIFHSVHTESLFLLLSLLSFWAFHEKKLLQAALWAGLAALTRHQGVFLAFALAFAAMLAESGWKRRLWVFAAMGCVSGLIWGLAPLLHFWEGRGWFPAMQAHQSHWFIADGIKAYFKTFILANPIQNYRLGSLLHHFFYGFLAWTVVGLWREDSRAAAIYCFLSLAIMPLQGELVDAFRFGAVLFPALLAWGRRWDHWPRWVAWPLLLALIGLNLLVTWQYAIARWAY